MVFAANGRGKPNVILVKGKEERHPEGQYYIEWRDPKRKREKVGTDAAEADTRRDVTKPNLPLSTMALL